MAKKTKEKKKNLLENPITQIPDRHNETQNKVYIESQPPSEEDEDEAIENNNITHKEKTTAKDKKKKETLDFKIQTLRLHPDKTPPVVGYFPTGFDPFKNGSFESGEPDPEEHKVRVYRNVERNKNNRLQVVVSPNGSQVNFVGTSYSGEAAAPQVCTYALGVLDKDTQTLKIVPIAANKIFRLQPKLGGPDGTLDETPENLKEELTAEEKADNLRHLTCTYSTKKTINKIKKQESLRQNQDPRSQEDLDKTLKDIKINPDVLEVDATTNARNIPPHDMSASTPQKAYPLEKIIFEGEWDYLKDLLESSQRAKVSPDVFPSFVCRRVYKLDDTKDEYEMNTVACVLSYITHLIKFKDKHSMDGHSSAKNHKIPSILSQKFRTKFGESDSKRLSDDKRNLLISYVLALTLFVDDYRSDPSDIAKDLRMNAIELRTHYEQLGCKFQKEGTVLLATLPVPLKFPNNTRRKRRRQR